MVGLALLAALLLTSAQAQTVISFARLSSQAHNAYLDPIIAAFEEANPDVRVVNVESAGDGYEGLAQTALLGLAAGSPPDLVQVGFTLLPTLVASGGPLALDPFMDDSGFDRSSLMPGMLELGELDGSHYIMPIGVSTPVMYYNLDLFRAAGLDPDKPPTTWEEAREAAQALVDAEVRLAAVPIPEGGGTRLPAGGNGVMLFSRDPAKQAAAWRFLEFLAGPVAGRIVAENTGYTPANAALLEELARENANDPDYVLVLEQMGNVVPWHAWPSDNGPRISQVIEDMQLEVLLGRATARAALDRALAEVNRLLAE